VARAVLARAMAAPTAADSRKCRRSIGDSLGRVDNNLENVPKRRKIAFAVVRRQFFRDREG
jgi:hypothetical protein